MKISFFILFGFHVLFAVISATKTADSQAQYAQLETALATYQANLQSYSEQIQEIYMERELSEKEDKTFRFFIFSQLFIMHGFNDYLSDNCLEQDIGKRLQNMQEANHDIEQAIKAKEKEYNPTSSDMVHIIIQWNDTLNILLGTPSKKKGEQYSLLVDWAKWSKDSIATLTTTENPSKKILDEILLQFFDKILPVRHLLMERLTRTPYYHLLTKLSDATFVGHQKFLNVSLMSLQSPERLPLWKSVKDIENTLFYYRGLLEIELLKQRYSVEQERMIFEFIEKHENSINILCKSAIVTLSLPLEGFQEAANMLLLKVINPFAEKWLDNLARFLHMTTFDMASFSKFQTLVQMLEKFNILNRLIQQEESQRNVKYVYGLFEDILRDLGGEFITSIEDAISNKLEQQFLKGRIVTDSSESIHELFSVFRDYQSTLKLELELLWSQNVKEITEVAQQAKIPSETLAAIMAAMVSIDEKYVEYQFHTRMDSTDDVDVRAVDISLRILWNSPIKSWAILDNLPRKSYKLEVLVYLCPRVKFLSKISSKPESQFKISQLAEYMESIIMTLESGIIDTAFPVIINEIMDILEEIKSQKGSIEELRQRLEHVIESNNDTPNENRVLFQVLKKYSRINDVPEDTLLSLVNLIDGIAKKAGLYSLGVMFSATEYEHRIEEYKLHYNQEQTNFTSILNKATDAELRLTFNDYLILNIKHTIGFIEKVKRLSSSKSTTRKLDSLVTILIKTMESIQDWRAAKKSKTFSKQLCSNSKSIHEAYEQVRSFVDAMVRLGNKSDKKKSK